SYGGPGALARARLAGEIVRERLKLTGVQLDELRIDLIGVDSLYGASGIDAREARGEPAELRLRVAGRCATAAEAARIGNEVETLYTNGPAGGGGATKAVREVLAVQSVLLPREQVRPVFTMLEVDDATA
ncbi:acyclic terpene utilization AtuA family protein, partial [Burkholderia gladioli]